MYSRHPRHFLAVNRLIKLEPDLGNQLSPQFTFRLHVFSEFFRRIANGLRAQTQQALHEHSTLDDRSIAPTYATSLDEYGDNNNDLEKNSISTFSAPISPQVLSPRTQSFPHDTKEPPNDVRQSLATKSANWLRLNLTQLSSRSQPQLSQHNEMPSEVSLPRPNKDVRLLSIMFNHQIKRTATG